jgi:protocatechuate 3,4-dioxygenase beta subunit
VQGVRPSSVRLANRTLSITMPRPAGMTCMVIGPGIAKILVTRAAQLGNPAAAGAYKLGVRSGTETFEATMTIVS